MHARMRAAVEGIDQGADFAGGHELDPETAALVPVTAIGRMLPMRKARCCRLLSGANVNGEAPGCCIWREPAREWVSFSSEGPFK
jgi:hypothetical protein